MGKMVRLSRDNTSIIRKIRNLQRRIDKELGCDKVVVYGGGAHTIMLFDFIDIPALNIRICDKKTTGRIKGIDIEKNTKELLDWGEAIIVSSYYRQKEIANKLEEQGYGKKLFLIYDQKDYCPFYESNVDLAVNCDAEIDFNLNPYLTYVDEGQGEKYEKTMEKSFFDIVTKDYFLEYINPGEKVLDVGAGTGRLSIECEKKGAYVYAVDTSKDMLNVLKRKNAKIETSVVDGVELPFSDEMFDKVVSCDAMVHFHNWKDFIKEHSRVVKKNGYIIYNMVNDDHLKRISQDKNIRTWYVTGGRGRFASVTRRELEQFCSNNNLELISMYPYGFFVLTAFSYGLLTRDEMVNLEQFYMGMCSNNEAAGVVKKFEKQVVKNLPEYMCESNMVVLRKR